MSQDTRIFFPFLLWFIKHYLFEVIVLVSMASEIKWMCIWESVNGIHCTSFKSEYCIVTSCKKKTGTIFFKNYVRRLPLFGIRKMHNSQDSVRRNVMENAIKNTIFDVIDIHFKNVFEMEIVHFHTLFSNDIRRIFQEAVLLFLVQWKLSSKITAGIT